MMKHICIELHFKYRDLLILTNIQFLKDPSPDYKYYLVSIDLNNICDIVMNRRKYNPFL